MFTTALIAFREFLEAFLIVSVFLGISRKLQLGREKEILFAAGLGFLFSFLCVMVTYFFGDMARAILTRDNAEVLEGYLLIFSGFFIAYVVFSLHDTLRKSRGGKLIKAHQKLQTNAFDVSLFLTIMTIVGREGFEIALFTASASLFFAFLQNVLGLFIGFFAASGVGFLTYLSYLRASIGRIIKVTEYLIILLGAAMVQNGITKILEHTFNIFIGKIIPFPLGFLPGENTPIGHFIQSFSGLDNEFSLLRLLIMLLYIGIIYLLFLRKANLFHIKKASN